MTLSRYPPDQLFEEVAFVAYHFNWSHDEVLALPHWERRRWCSEISRINERINADGGSGATGGVDLRSLVATESGSGGASTPFTPGSNPGVGRPTGFGDEP